MKILKEITPSRWEKYIVNRRVSSILEELKKDIPSLTIELGGSFAKNTWLSGDHDIDIFVKFPYEKYQGKDISKALKSRLNNITVVHGSRDYFQIRRGKFVIELIPVLDIKDPKQAANVTDMSPFHTRWAKENIKNPDQVRLLKKFMKANGLYGAESFIKGFSGYVCEVLIGKYHTFFDLIKDSSNWPERKYIDVQDHYPDLAEAMKKINKERHGPLILVDPVHPERNAAAALSEEKYGKFVELSKEFLRNPTDSFFESKTMNLSILGQKKEDNKLVYVSGIPIEGKRDVIGAKLLKTNEALVKEVEVQGFSIIDYGWEYGDTVLLWFIIDPSPLSEKVKKWGPPIEDKQNLKSFADKWKGHKLGEENGRTFVIVPRKIRAIEEFLELYLNEENMKYFQKYEVKVL